MNQNPSQLAQKAAGEPGAFGELYEQYFSRVYNYIRCRCFEADTADDLTSQVFERLLECIHQYRPERGAFEPWLFAIVRNMVNGHYRKNRSLWEALDFLRRQAPSGPVI
jgi:RNA polymerase sigma factor (sigma-70 family)